MLEPITTDATSPGWTGLLTLVSAIGSGQFETALSHYLDEVCGVEHVGIFRSVDDVPLPISAISADGTDVSEHHTHIQPCRTLARRSDHEARYVLPRCC